MVQILQQPLEITIPPRLVPGGTLVTAQSYLIDRIAPDCEIIHLPPTELQGGVLRLKRGAVDSAPAKRRRRLRLGNVAPEAAPAGRQIIDLRHHDPLNWAHFLNNHLPLVFHTSDVLGLDWADLLLVMPEDTPGYIHAAAALFGFELWCTDAPVRGEGLTIEVTPWTGVRPARMGWAQSPRVQAALAGALAAAPKTDLPKKVFLSRKDTRTLANEAEIETVLVEQGYTKVYAEDFSAIDQIRLFLQADDIVAVHGAGQAPFLYCTEDARPRRMIELLPCGHMTNVYRAMAAELGTEWIGVRGRLKPEYVKPAYQLAEKFRAFSLDEFEVDPVSLERAMGMLDDAERAG